VFGGGLKNAAKEIQEQSMSNQAIETVSTGADRAKLVVAFLCVVAGIVGFYMLTKQGPIARGASLAGGLILGAVIALISDSGKAFIGFFKEAVKEAKRVVWPDRKETIQITIYVFVFVIVMSLLLFGTDKLLEWVLFDKLLGWKR
jgi:preprotein translocase subunit SecE